MNKREAAFHLSAEQYRERAKLARTSVEFESNADQRAKLLVQAREYEQLATSLESMRMKRLAPLALAISRTDNLRPRLRG